MICKFEPLNAMPTIVSISDGKSVIMSTSNLICFFCPIDDMLSFLLLVCFNGTFDIQCASSIYKFAL